MGKSSVFYFILEPVHSLSKRDQCGERMYIIELCRRRRYITSSYINDLFFWNKKCCLNSTREKNWQQKI